MPDNVHKSPARLSIYLAVASAAVTAAVLASPFGIGNGSGVIGYSIMRLLVLVIVQAPLGLAGVIFAILALARKRGGLAGLAVNLLVPAATIILYFDQGRTFERLL